MSVKCRSRGRKCMFWLHENVPYQTVCRRSGRSWRRLYLPAGQHVHRASFLSAKAARCPLMMGRSTFINVSVVVFSLVKIREQRACKLCPKAGHSLHRNERRRATTNWFGLCIASTDHWVKVGSSHRPWVSWADRGKGCLLLKELSLPQGTTLKWWPWLLFFELSAESIVSTWTGTAVITFLREVWIHCLGSDR